MIPAAIATAITALIRTLGMRMYAPEPDRPAGLRSAPSRAGRSASFGTDFTGSNHARTCRSLRRPTVGEAADVVWSGLSQGSDASTGARIFISGDAPWSLRTQLRLL